MSITPELDSIGFSTPHQYKQVESNNQGIVWETSISGGYTAFVDNIYIKWYESTWLELIIDGTSIFGRIEHTIGSLEEPQKYNPPWVARNFIRVVAHNEDSNSHVFEALIDGTLVKPKV